MTEKEPLVSVIMNCYNGEKYLKEAIDSVYAQTYQNWEVIFWDNASTDRSALIAKSYDKKLRYFRSKETTVLGKARTLAVNKAKGELLAFLDCDDLWLPEKLNQQVNIFSTKGDIGIVYSRTELINSGGSSLGFLSSQYEKLPAGQVFSELVKYNFIPFVSAIIPTNIYYDSGGFPMEYKNSTDYALFLNISHKYQVVAIDDVLCCYRLHGDNLSNRQKVIASYESINVISKFLPSKPAEKGLQYQYVELFISSIREFDISMLFFSILKTRRYDLLSHRIYAGLKNAIQK